MTGRPRSKPRMPALGPAPRGSRARARLAAERLAWVLPARSVIEFESELQLLVAVVLSAQSTDRMANRLARELLERYPGPAELAAADLPEVERILRPIGFYRAKSRAVVAASRALLDREGGALPRTLDELVTLPGIGRKSASAILVIGFGLPAIVSDRHLIRVAGRLRLVSAPVPLTVERQLKRLLPSEAWTPLSLRMTLHGRRTCLARRPVCGSCVLNDFCPSSATTDWPMERRVALALSLRDRSPAGRSPR